MQRANSVNDDYQANVLALLHKKKSPKKFSGENNMNPGDVLKELKGLTEIEEMLIAQVFMVMSVY